MPAQWPTFISNVSKKLESRSAKSRKEFAMFLANEYFNAVKTSQTPFGNMHQSGQKPILENGFIKAFKEIFENENIKFEDKFNMSSFADFLEPFPGTDIQFDPLCEIEEWIRQNKKDLSKFQFYQFFPTTCPAYKEIDPYDGIDIDAEIKKADEDAQNVISNSSDGYLYATMSISDFTPNTVYKFVYDINGIEQPPLNADKDGILVVRVSDIPGEYTYTFKSVLDPDDNLIKEINKSAKVTIGSDGVTEIPATIEDPSKGKKLRQIVAEMTEGERNEMIANRILLQSDGTKYFRNWIDRLKYGNNGSVGQKVAEIVLSKFEKWYQSESKKLRILLEKRLFKKNKVYYNNQRKNIDDKIEAIIQKDVFEIAPTRAQLIDDGIIKEDILNEYVFQNDYETEPNTIPKWLNTKDYICKFTYDSKIDKVEADGEGFRQSVGESTRIKSKIKKWKKERKEWWQLLRDWANSKNTGEDGEASGGDGYNMMAKAIIDYWKSTLVQPFKPTPPIPPCNVPAPLGGIYTPISYGSEAALANDLRRAWNTGKRFSKQPLTPVASKLVATAVAVACAKHLLKLKFLYLGGITTPVSPVPMVGFVPLTI